MSLAVVVFPHPDSPMTPNVSPGYIWKSIPSTALTHELGRQNISPSLTGKYFFKPRTSRSGWCTLQLLLLGHQPALGFPVIAGSKVWEFFNFTAVHDFGTAGVEGIPLGQCS